jgi:hypothetical protein
MNRRWPPRKVASNPIVPVISVRRIAKEEIPYLDVADPRIIPSFSPESQEISFLFVPAGDLSAMISGNREIDMGWPVHSEMGRDLSGVGEGQFHGKRHDGHRLEANPDALG